MTRDVTERPEAIAAGTVTLVGTKIDVILREVGRALTCGVRSDQYPAFNPYGDGLAAQRIVESLRAALVGRDSPIAAALDLRNPKQAAKSGKECE